MIAGPGTLPPSGERRPPDGSPAGRAAARSLLREALAGAPPWAGPWLAVESGGAPGRRLRLGGEQVLGRAASAELRLPDPHLSRRHARITCASGEVFLEDLGSRGGTLRNGRRIGSGRHALAPGDEIRAGATRLRLMPSLAAGSVPAGPGAGASRRGASGAAGAAAVLFLAACALAAAALA